ncbi:hypothetical protein ILUMI_06772 [Ignelater luminosus]|uniref:Integrase catalytic domain-containing protein n=1 Tax=Ignelater luminosus TaxID=2038154 RepID=A0A8K0DA03_IGNLU|nr:hypothetical protein ILUMI_06772 [Ignelater luminosus]
MTRLVSSSDKCILRSQLRCGKKNNTNPKADRKFRCKRCKTTHEPRECPVYEIEGKKVRVKIDTEGDVNVLPLNIFKHVNEQFKVRAAQYMSKAFEGTMSKPRDIRYIVLPYGLSDLRDLFEEEVEKHFENIKNIIICHRDIIAAGTTREEHDRGLICEKYMPSNSKEAMLPHLVPKLRFNKIGADILEYGSKSYMIVIDHFSHWTEIFPLASKTSEAVINLFQDVFTKFGYPQHIVADNLPFVSYKCKTYYSNKYINIITCTPHHHQSNGLAEKAVSISKQILFKSRDEKNNYYELLLEYNNIPILNLDASPSQILQSRILRTQLPITSKKLEPQMSIYVHKKIV